MGHQKSAIEFADAIVSPVTVAEFKTFARIENDDEETYLANLLIATTENAIKYLGRCLLTQSMTYRFSEFEDADKVELPYCPLQTIEGFYYLDSDVTWNEVDSDDYFTVTESIPGALIFKIGVSQPVKYFDYGFKISYTTGYGDDNTDVPESIRQAIMIWANTGYANKMIATEPPPEVRSALSLYRVVHL